MGYLTSQDFRQMKNANVASKQLIETFINTGVALGKIQEGEVTLANFTESLNDHWADTEVMENAFGYFAEMTEKAYELVEAGDFDTATEAYAYLAEQYDTVSIRAAKAAQEAKTFEEAIEATKDAVSSKWQTTWEYIFGNYEEAKELWSWLAEELWEVFASGGDDRNELLQLWHDGIDGVSGYALAIEALENIWYGFKDILYAVKDAIADVFPPQTAENLIAITERFRDATEVFRNAFKYEGVEDFVDGLFGADAEEDISSVNNTLDSTIVSMEAIEALGRRIMSGEFGNNPVRQAAIEALDLFPHAYELAQNWVETQYGYAEAYEVTGVTIVETEEEVAAVMAEMAEAMDTATEATEDFSDSTDDTSDAIDNITILKNIVSGLASGVDLLRQTASAAWNVVLKPMLAGAGKLLRPLFVQLGNAGAWLTNFAKTARENGTIQNFLQGIVDGFSGLGNQFSSFIDSARSLPSVAQFLQYFGQFRDWINGIKDDAITRVTNFFNNLDVSEYLPSQETLLGILDSIMTKVNNFIALCEAGWPAVQSFFDSLDFSSAGETISSLKDTAIEFITGIFDDERVKTSASNWFSNVWQGIKDSVKEIDLGEIFGTAFKGVSIASLAATLVGLGKFFYGIGSFVKDGATIPDSFIKVMGGVRDVLKSFSWDLKAFALIEVAVAIGILAAALWALSQIPEDSLRTAASELAIVIGVLIGLAAVIGKFWGTNGKDAASAIEDSFIQIGKINLKLPNMALTIAAIAGGVYLLSEAFAKMSSVLKDLDSDTLVLTTEYIAGFAITLVTLGALFSKYGSNISIGSAVGILAIAEGVNIMADAFGKLVQASAFQSNFDSALKALAVMLAGLAVIIKVAQKVNFGAMLGVGIGFVLLSAGMRVMIGAINSLSKLVEEGDPWAIGIAIAGIAAIIAAFSTIVSHAQGVSFGALIGVSVAFAAMAASIQYFLVPAFTALSDLKLGQLIVIALSLGVVIAALTASMVIASKHVNGDGMLSLLEMAGAVVALSAGLALLANSNTSSMLKGAAILVGVVAIFTGLAALVGKFQFIGAGITTLSMGLLAFGGAIAIAGVGALAFAEALTVLSDSSLDAKAAGKNLAEGIVAFFDEIMANGQSIIEFVGVVVMAIIGVILAKKVMAANAVVEVVEAIVEALKSGTLIASVIGVLGILLATILEFLGLNVEYMITAIVAIAIKIINGISLAIVQNGGQFWNALGNLILALGNLILQLISNILHSLNVPFADWFDKYALGIIEGTDTTYLEQAIKDNNAALDATIEEAADNMIRSSEKYKAAAETAGINMSEGLNNLNISTPGGNGGITGIDEKYTGGVSGIGLDSLPVQIGSAFDSATAAINVGSENAQAAAENGLDSLMGKQERLKGGVLDEETEVVSTLTSYGPGYIDESMLRLGDMEDAGSSLTEAGLDGGAAGQDSASPSKKWALLALDAIQGYIMGINENEALVIAPVKSMMQIAISALRGHYQDYYTQGQNLVIGFVNGINAYSNLAYNAAKSMAQKALNAISNTMDSHSPSRETMLRGRYAAEGFAIGIDNNAYMAEKSAGSMASGVLNSFQDAVSRIIDAIDGDFDMDPTIRPVLDLSEIQNGASMLNGMFGGYAISPDLSYARTVMPEMNSIGKYDGSRNDNAGETHVLEEIRSIKSEIKGLSNSMAKMRLVLDSGQLVGGIISGIDEELSVRYSYEKRGASY